MKIEVMYICTDRRLTMVVFGGSKYILKVGLSDVCWCLEKRESS